MMKVPYDDRLTRMPEVRTVADWKLKIYTICGPGSVVETQTIEAAIRFAVEQVDWPSEAKNKYGFLTLHAGEEAVWLLVDLWMEDILRHFVFRAPCDAQEDFGPGPDNGTMACVWELAVIMHERESWIRHVLATDEQPNFAAYVEEALEIVPRNTCR